MAKPSRLPIHASDTNFATGPDTGTPTKVEPSAGIKAQGFVPGTGFLAQHVNDLLWVIVQWILWVDSLVASDEFVYPAVKTRSIAIAPTECKSGHSSTDIGATTVDPAVAITGRWQPSEQTLFGAGPGGSDIFGPSTIQECNAKGVVAYLDLTPHLRNGMTFASLSVYVEAGTAQGVATNRVLVRLMKRVLSTWAAPTTIASTTTTNSAGQQTVSLGLLSEVVDRTTTTYWLEIVSSQGATTTPDKFGGALLGVQDPGPRNN